MAWLGVISPFGPCAASEPDTSRVGGSASDYEQAASYRDDTSGLVLNEHFQPVWAGERTLVFREDVSRETWRFVQVDARTGARSAAFDHEALAAAIAERAPGGGEVRADALPISLGSDQAGSVLVYLPGGDALRIDLESGERTLFTGGDDDPRLLPQSGRRRSRNEGGDTEIVFVNRTREAVKVYWVDGAGSERQYGVVDPGQKRPQHTYAGHLWRLESGDGVTLGYFKARRTSGIASVTQHSRPVEANETEEETSSEAPERFFIRDANLWERVPGSGAERQLTHDGTDDDYYTTRTHLSPDGKHLVVIRTTDEQEHLVRMVESAPDDQLQPRLHTHQYIKPGDVIAHPRPVLIDLESGEVCAIDDALFPTPWTLREFTWDDDSSGFWFLYNQRGHRVMRVIRVDVSDVGARAIIDESPETFVDYANKTFLRILPGSREVFWMSERSGWNHLYRIDLDTGEALNSVTSGEWVVRSVHEFDPEHRTIRVRAKGVIPGHDPYYDHYGVVAFEGGEFTWLTQDDGSHSIELSPSGEFLIDTWSRVDHPPVRQLRRASDGSLICELSRADWSELLGSGWRPPDRFVAKGRDGETDIHGVIFTPSNFDPSARYPVIENIYAGPHNHFVPKRFSHWHGSRELAELGFVVVRIDGMGTNWRHKAFHDVAWKNLGDSGFPDRIAWMKAAAVERPWMDLDRVGIYGGSAGGQSALRAMIAHNDFYDAAVADCGCHDNRMDKIWWNELWMSWPIGPHYEEQSNVTQAHKLEGELMLIVGELDSNVDPASTMQVVDALIKADKDFDLIVMTSVGHGAAETPYGKRRRADFFVEHLLGVEPRWKDDRP